jgi:hypothetical protein
MHEQTKRTPVLIDINSKDNIFCEWLHVCAAKDENAFSNRSTWEGKLKAMKREIGREKNLEKKMELSDLKADGVEKNLEKKMELTNLKVDELKNELKKDMDDMNKKLDTLMELLTKKA